MASPTMRQSRPRSGRTSRRRYPVALLPMPLRSLRRDVIAWCLRTATPVDPDTLTAVLAAKCQLPGPWFRWSAHDVQRLCWVEIVDWCDNFGVAPPADATHTLAALLCHLVASEQLAAGSDSIRDLLTAAEECGHVVGDAALHVPG